MVASGTDIRVGISGIDGRLCRRFAAATERRMADYTGYGLDEHTEPGVLPVPHPGQGARNDFGSARRVAAEGRRPGRPDLARERARVRRLALARPDYLSPVLRLTRPLLQQGGPELYGQQLVDVVVELAVRSVQPLCGRLLWDRWSKPCLPAIPVNPFRS